MVQRSCRARFLSEPHQALGIAGQRWGENFYGDIAIQSRVAGAVHLAHPARAQRRLNLIGPKLCAKGQSHVGRIIAQPRGLLSKSPQGESRRVGRVFRHQLVCSLNFPLTFLNRAPGCDVETRRRPDIASRLKALEGFLVFRLPIAMQNAVSYAVARPFSAAAIFYHIHGTSRKRVRSQYSP